MKSKYQVVIIDDHDLMRRGFISALGEDWTVTGQATDLAEAREVLAALPAPPDLIVLDITLKNNEWGLDLVPHLEERYGKKAPPVLVHSVYADYAHIQAAIGMGVKGYVSKDEGFPVLETAMQTVVRGQVYITQKMLAKLSSVPDLIGGLTKREKQIFLQVQQGWDNRHIAKEYSLLPRTVECYLNRNYSTLGVKHRKELQNL
jgi:NarL family two-component system response regulator LiaR